MCQGHAGNFTKHACHANCKSIPIAIVLLIVMSTAAFANSDVGSNNDFFSAQILPAGSLTVSGELESQIFGTPFAQQTGTLFPGGVVSHDFVVTPGSSFTAAIDNTVSGTDTTLGSFDESFNLIASDDDSSFLGTGLGSALPVTGNSDGSIHLRVSGFSDFDFDGLSDGGTTAHPQTGAYTLLLLDGVIAGDVDVFAFTGLTAGQSFSAETFSGATGNTPDTVLGWFDDLGVLIATDDDGGVGTLSQLDVTVPDSGTLFLGVSGFADFGFVGQHNASGSYELSLQAVPVPEPTAIALLLWALAGVGLRRQR